MQWRFIFASVFLSFAYNTVHKSDNIPKQVLRGFS